MICRAVEPERESTLIDRNTFGDQSVTRRTAKAYADLFRQRLGCHSKREIPEAYMRLTGINPYPADGGKAAA